MLKNDKNSEKKFKNYKNAEKKFKKCRKKTRKNYKIHEKQNKIFIKSKKKKQSGKMKWHFFLALILLSSPWHEKTQLYKEKSTTPQVLDTTPITSLDLNYFLILIALLRKPQYSFCH